MKLKDFFPSYPKLDGLSFRQRRRVIIGYHEKLMAEDPEYKLRHAKYRKLLFGPMLAVIFAVLALIFVPPKNIAAEPYYLLIIWAAIIVNIVFDVRWRASSHSRIEDAIQDKNRPEDSELRHCSQDAAK